MTQKESEIEQDLIKKLEDLKYSYRPDIRDKASLEQNFRDKFEALNHVHLTDAEFARLRDEIIHQNRGNGYIWHTTGSGKTLTNIRTRADLLTRNALCQKQAQGREISGLAAYE